MFTTLAPSPDLQNALAALPPRIADEVRRVFTEYARLKDVSAVEHEALCGVLDTLHIRLDDIPRDPEYARTVAVSLTRRAVEGIVLSTDTGTAVDWG